MRVIAGLIATVFLLNLAGCSSSDWGTATGTVTLDGKPLEKGRVTLEPEAGGATAYAQINAGKFTVMTGAEQGLKVGNYKVMIIDQTIPEFGTDQQPEILTPLKYSSPETTDLTATIKAGHNQLEFVMKK
jgi:hypothetical protein